MRILKLTDVSLIPAKTAAKIFKRRVKPKNISKRKTEQGTSLSVIKWTYAQRLFSYSDFFICRVDQ